MAPGHEIVIRALGSALAGLSMAFAIYMVAYGGGKTRINGMEHLAIFAQPRGPGGSVGGPAAQPAENAPQVDMAATGSVAAAGAKAPSEIVAAQADRVWLKIDGAIRTAAPGDSVAGLGRIGRSSGATAAGSCSTTRARSFSRWRKARTAPRSSPAGESSSSRLTPSRAAWRDLFSLFDVHGNPNV